VHSWPAAAGRPPMLAGGAVAILALSGVARSGLRCLRASVPRLVPELG
jgi:hypothetical protein